MEVHSLLVQSTRDPMSGMLKDGVVCNLKTGPLRKKHKAATHCASVIDMVNFEEEYDVAVIDEIQMIADAERGCHWTNAVLGLKAREIHLCGDSRALGIIAYLLEKTGDELTIHEYERLSPLKVDEKPLKDWSELRDGDCVVTFSKKQIYRYREEIN
jgi:ATP-dependent RNA helicase SUPV3L1/SUV3